MGIPTAFQYGFTTGAFIGFVLHVTAFVAGLSVSGVLRTLFGFNTVEKSL